MQRAVGSVEAVKYSQQEEAAARAAVIEYETAQGDYNMLQSESGRNLHIPTDLLTLFYRC